MVLEEHNITVPDNFRETEIGLLPEEWRVKKLGEVVLKTTQSDPKKSPHQRFKYVDVSAVSNEALAITGYAEHEGRTAPSRARKLIQSRDVLFATVRPYLRRVAKVPPELDGDVCSTAFCVIRANPDSAESDFLYFSVSASSFVDRVSEYQHGSGYPAVTDKDVLSQPIPLPPLPEQKAIAQVLRIVQKAIETTEQVIESTRELKRSLMNHLFTYGPVPVDEAEQVPLKETEVGPVPEHWEVVELGQVATLQRGKDLPVKQREDGHYPVIGANGVVDYHSEYVAEGPGVLVGRSGSVGKVTWAASNYWPLNTSLWVKDFHGNTPEFVYRLLGNMDFSRYAAGVSVPTLNRNLVHPINVAVPSLAEQEEIAYILRTVEEKVTIEENRKQSLEVLFKTLLHNLMTGKLRVRDLDLSKAEEMV